MPALAQGSQSTVQLLVLPSYAIAKDMEFAVADAGADFHAGNDFNPQFSSDSQCFRDAGYNVVVCDGERGDPSFMGEP